MPWHVVIKKPKLVQVLTHGVLAGAFMALLWAFPVSAVDNQIGVTICGTNGPSASISLTEPNNDSVVNQPTVTFRGTVSNTSQVEVEVDGGYATTIAIGNNQTTFATDISLTAGTHTVTMTANDICNGQDAVDSVVITYEPAVPEPSNGGVTPTEVGSGEPVTGVTVSDEPIDENETTQPIEELPVIGTAISTVVDIADRIGLGATFSNGNVNVVVGTARVGLTVAALTAIVMASSIAPAAAAALPGLSEAFNVNSHRSMLYLGWIIRGAGILTMAVVYFL